MRVLLVYLSISVACAAGPAAALDKIRITDSKKTVEKRQSDTQKLPRGTTSLTEKQIVYIFDLQRMAPDVPETVTASWVLIREDMKGRLAEASRGTSVVVLPLGRATSVETEPITMEERDWIHRKGAGSLSTSLAGYGLRILDVEGKVIAERYDPKSIQSEISWDPPKQAGARQEELKRELHEERALQRAQKPERQKRP